ncbi:hypothetical protein AcW1_004113 [Taiwanofungus camphoratus]|nr:hypothetical protein AcW1_004113 [Antrodia cinnamomea]
MLLDILILGILGAFQASAANVLKVPFSSTLIPNFAKFFDSSSPTSNAALKVVIPVTAGNNQVFSNVLVDTGSAVLWVGGEQKYVPGPNTQTINQTFSVGYGSGGVNGTAYMDHVTIGSATASSQIIGSAGYMEGFTLVQPIDGILGLGPSGSNYHEVSGYNTTPTFVENLVSDGVIDKPVFGIYVSPLSESGIPEGSGEITFGGIDQSRISGAPDASLVLDKVSLTMMMRVTWILSGDISWLPQNEPLNFHWEFNVRICIGASIADS